jgi:putative Mg2+ transporter-C (MgtC) family protein
MVSSSLMTPHVLASGANIEGWTQVGELGLALLLSALIGLEREMRQKSAGLRTHTLVGVGAALFMLISKYGFNDVLEPGRIVLDPSRIGAQIVTGVGFLGAGLIFVKRDSVRGLTTAAAIWVTAAVGAASGAGLPVLAVMTTAIYFLIALVFPVVTRRLPQSSTAVSMIRVRYPDGRGLLRQLLEIATQRGFAIDEVSTEMVDHPRSASGEDSTHGRAVAEVTLHVHGKSSINELAAAFSEVDEVEAVLADDINAVDE